MQPPQPARSPISDPEGEVIIALERLFLRRGSDGGMCGRYFIDPP